jgi:hypothetical protein
VKPSLYPAGEVVAVAAQYATYTSEAALDALVRVCAVMIMIDVRPSAAETLSADRAAVLLLDQQGIEVLVS